MKKLDEVWVKLNFSRIESSYVSDEWRSELYASIVHPPRYDSDREKGFSWVKEYTFEVKPTTYYHRFNFRGVLWGNRSSTYEIGYWDLSREMLRADRLAYMAKTAAAVDKAIVKLEDEFGRPDTMGGHLFFFAKAVKAKKMIWVNESGIIHKTSMINGDLLGQLNAAIDERSEECALLSGNGTKSAVMVTTAPENYDCEQTRSELMDWTCGSKQIRKVEITPEWYVWQTQRYHSGNYLVMKFSDFKTQRYSDSRFQRLTEKVETSKA